MHQQKITYKTHTKKSWMLYATPEHAKERFPMMSVKSSFSPHNFTYDPRHENIARGPQLLCLTLQPHK